MTKARRRLSGMDVAILHTVRDGPCRGMNRLIDTINASDRQWCRMRVRALQRDGLIDLDIPPVFGRGHAIIIRRASDR